LFICLPEDNENYVYIDCLTKELLQTKWEGAIIVKGRRDIKAHIRELREIDSNVQIIRVPFLILDKLMVEYGEDVLLENL
jgi:hypothetical protein